MVSVLAIAQTPAIRKDPQATNRDAQIQPANGLVYNPNQLPNYYQNNSSYNNNSSQNNKPANPDANAFPGNGNYTDPTRPANNFFRSSYDQPPVPGPLNTVNTNPANGR